MTWGTVWDCLWCIKMSFGLVKIGFETNMEHIYIDIYIYILFSGVDCRFSGQDWVGKPLITPPKRQQMARKVAEGNHATEDGWISH